MESLPDDLVAAVLLRLGTLERASCETVCKGWRRALLGRSEHTQSLSLPWDMGNNRLAVAIASRPSLNFLSLASSSVMSVQAVKSLCRSSPVLSLELEGPFYDVVDIASLLEKVNNLSVYAYAHGDEDVFILSQLCSDGKLRTPRLDIQNVLGGDAELDLLSECLRNGGIDSLSISLSSFSAASRGALASFHATLALASLTQLSFSDCALVDNNGDLSHSAWAVDAAIAVLRHPPCRLESLALIGARVDDAACAAIAGAIRAGGASLASLRVEYCGVTSRGAAEIVSALLAASPKLDSLSLEGNPRISPRLAAGDAPNEGEEGGAGGGRGVECPWEQGMTTWQWPTPGDRLHALAAWLSLDCAAVGSSAA